jgi:prenyltransferase beta subunit
MDELVVLESRTQIKGKVYCRIKVQSTENEYFKAIIEVFKKHHGLYIDEIKRWFINENYIASVEAELKPIVDQAEQFSLCKELIEQSAKEIKIETLGNWAPKMGDF